MYSVYAPKTGRPVEDKERFWGEIDDDVKLIPNEEDLIIGGDLNEHVGDRADRLEEVMRRFGLGILNEDGERILQFCQSNGLRLLNTFFKKPRQHLVSYSSGGAETQIDYILMRKNNLAQVKDCKAIPEEVCLTQHRLLTADWKVERRIKKKRERTGKIKIWKMKDDQIREQFKISFSHKVRGLTGG